MLAVFFQMGRQPSVTDFHFVVRLIGIGQSVTSPALSPGSWTMSVYSEEHSGVEINIAFNVTGILIFTQNIGQDLVSQYTKSCGQNGKTCTGRARLIRSHSSARFCFEISGNSN